MSTRTKNSIRNMKYAVIGQVAGLLMSFLSRMVFVRTLSAEYLGLDGLFANILSILSFAELGIGSAIVYSMYQPLEEKDTKKLKALMRLYKKSYFTIGIVIGGVGILLTPFLELFIKDMPSIPYIKVIYLMFVMNSAITYFFSYKRSLLIADQKRYITTLYRYGFYVVLTLTQILVLWFTKNYFLYLGLMVGNTLLESILVSKKAEKLYPFLKEQNKENLEEAQKNLIIRNIRAMVFHKTGEIVVSGTDNLLISKLIGVAFVGLYSNYLLVFNALNMVFGMGFQAILSSVGNLGVTQEKQRQEFVFRCMNLAGFWMFGMVSICLLNLLNPLIGLWLGSKYLFSMEVVWVLVLNFYLGGMRRSVLTFRDALGLYWYDRHKPLFESIINLSVSLVLGYQIGMVGIFIGTLVSTLTTCFWIEPMVLYKYGFQASVIPYFKKYAVYSLVMVFAGILSWQLGKVVSGEGIISFLGKAMLNIVVVNAIFAGCFWKTKEFQYFLSIRYRRV